jgi:TonB family protein
MLQLMQRRDADDIELIECSPHSRPPRLDLSVHWESPWHVFWTSVRDFFTGPRAPKSSKGMGYGSGSGRSVFRVEWIREKVPGWAFTASTLWHIAIVLLLILPIWGFLPVTEHTLAPVRIELTYLPAQDLPPISLPGVVSNPSPAGDPAKPLPQLGADAFHPRQTILSMPLHITHPRQTLIQPDAPAAAPKMEPPLPNIVSWTTPSVPRPQIQNSPTAAAPRVERRAAQDVAAPEIPNAEKNSGPFNLASSPIANRQPQMPMSPMSAAAAASARRQTNQDAGAAPEIGAASTGDSELHQVIALSASPAPPAAEVNVPQGNSAARIAISPDGKQAGVPGGVEHGAAGNGGTDGNAESMGGTNGAGRATRGSGGGGNANRNSPVAVSVSGGSNDRTGSGGGISPAGPRPAGKLNLKPMPSSEPLGSSHHATVDVSHLDPSVPPEKILSGKEIFTLHVNMPNLTSVAGSWILNCAQLDEGDEPAYKPKGDLSGPAPVEKVDPKYPQSIIDQHVDGEVVLYAIIRKDGSVDSIQIVRRLEPQLDKNSIEALARWKFRPGTRAGVPIDIEAVVHIPFRFRNPNDQ